MRKGKDLEKIITAIEKSLPSQGKVIPNYRVKDKETGRSRQIDIAIINKDAYREIFCMIEVKDLSRRVGSPDIEKLKGIKESVNAHKAIIVSRSGFSKPAIKKAKIHSIETLTFEELDKENWFDWIGFDKMEFLNWEILYYRNGTIILTPPVKIETIDFDIKLSQFRKKVFINPINSKKLSLSDLMKACLTQNPQLSAYIPLDGSIVTRKIPIRLTDELSLITKQGNFPIQTIIAEIDLKVTKHKLPIKAHTYRNVGKDETIAQVFTAILPTSSGKKKMTVSVPGKGKIGGRTITVNVHDIEEDNS
jgi:hypothetical protein